MNPKPVNVVESKDDKRKFTIYYEDSGKFLVHTENYEEVDESLTEYSFESFVKMYRLMDLMINKLCMSNANARKKLFKIKKPEIKTNKI